MQERDELVAAVQARVDRVAATREWYPVLELAAFDEALRLARYVASNTADLEAAYALGWLHYCRARARPPEQAERDRDATVHFFTPCFIAGAPNLPQPLLAALAEQAVPAAMHLLTDALNTKDQAPLTTAVALWRRITRSIPDDHPDHAAYLSFLGIALESRFDRVGELVDLDEAVEMGRAAVRAVPPGHPDRAALLANLGNALLKRFERFGELRDVDEAVEAGRGAVQATPPDHPDRASRLSNVGVALATRFRRFGELRDLDEALEVGRAATRAVPPGHPDCAALLSSLGHTLLTRFGCTEEPADLDEAVEMGRAAIRAVPPGHPDRARLLSNLGNALQERFLRFGELRDVDEAVEASRGAVQATPPDHPDRAGLLSNLGNALQERFLRFGELRDVDEAVEAGRSAVQATPPDHPDRAGFLSNLGLFLLKRFERTGDLGDLDEAVHEGRAAVQATPYDHPKRAKHLSHLSIALLTRFERTEEPADLDEAVEVCRAAVRAVPHSHPDRALCLHNLSNALLKRFDHFGELRDLDEAVQVGRGAVRATPDDHPDRAAYLSDLGLVLFARFERTEDPADQEAAVAVWGQVVEMETASPRRRLGAARAAAHVSASSDPARAAGLLEQAVLLLPEVAPRRLRRGDQQHALGKTTDLAADAVALALAESGGNARERAVRALRLAEAGRAVILSQALDTRSDLTDLRDQQPDLARRFSELCELLDQDPTAAATAARGGRTAVMGRERHRLAAELEALLGRIRASKGFDAFGLPPTSRDLLAEAAHGPVVTFNVSRYGSDALLLTSGGITSCPLPELTRDTVIDQVSAFYQALSDATTPNNDRIGAQQTLRQILEWLWEAAAEPTLSALEALGEVMPPAQDGAHLPRVWWAPGGLLGLLPVHAAGFHTDPGDSPHRRTVLDRVISSYTPTIRALRHARGRRPRPADHSQSLIVAMPTTSGHSPLPHVPAEARRISALLHRPVQLIESGPGSDGSPSPDTPTAATVLAHLPQSAIAHFACHGVIDYTDPSQSGLLLHDHATTPLTVSALAQVNLDGAQLAYLSACSTAAPGSPDLLDEAIHLVSAFQLAGFPHVVGALWDINDRLAVEIAESFYTRLIADPTGTLHPDLAATALHQTIRAVRDRYPATPSLWAAYLHTGA
ncbi:CHAT domain-containing protein [Streptomyces lydicus]|uniref:CHAT domain-containing protein n=1 Tax=Streptomyces lydicus TaxID=47763 RepID=UPI0037A6E1E3